ncbi:MAG: hypothetical protein ACYC6N_15060, partial [Pirellulaceae bacterium]
APPAPPATTPAAAADAAPPTAPEKDRTSRDLVLDARVVTLATIERQLTNIQRVLVRPDAVVTPSVKDDLRKRRVRLEVVAVPVTSDKPAGELTVARCTRTPEGARDATALVHPAGVSVMGFDDLRCATRTVARLLEDVRRVGVVLTDDPLVAVCLANRLPTIRAAWVRNVAELKEAIATIGANLLIVHPGLLTQAIWSEMLSLFRQDLPRRCPGELSNGPGHG